MPNLKSQNSKLILNVLGKLAVGAVVVTATLAPPDQQYMVAAPGPSPNPPSISLPIPQRRVIKNTNPRSSSTMRSTIPLPTNFGNPLAIDSSLLNLGLNTLDSSPSPPSPPGYYINSDSFDEFTPYSQTLSQNIVDIDHGADIELSTPVMGRASYRLESAVTPLEINDVNNDDQAHDNTESVLDSSQINLMSINAMTPNQLQDYVNTVLGEDSEDLDSLYPEVPASPEGLPQSPKKTMKTKTGNRLSDYNEYIKTNSNGQFQSGHFIKLNNSVQPIPGRVYEMIKSYFTVTSGPQQSQSQSLLTLNKESSTKNQISPEEIKDVYDSMQFLQEHEARGIIDQKYHKEFTNLSEISMLIYKTKTEKNMDYLDLIIKKREYMMSPMSLSLDPNQDKDVVYGYRVRICLKKYLEPMTNLNGSINRDLIFDVIEIERLTTPLKMSQQSPLLRKFVEFNAVADDSAFLGKETKNNDRHQCDLLRQVNFTTKVKQVQPKSLPSVTESNVVIEDLISAARELNNYIKDAVINVVSQASKSSKAYKNLDKIKESSGDKEMNQLLDINIPPAASTTTDMPMQLSPSNIVTLDLHNKIANFLLSTYESEYEFHSNAISISAMEITEKSKELRFFQSLAQSLKKEEGIRVCPICIEDLNFANGNSEAQDLNTTSDETPNTAKANIYPHCCGNPICESCFITASLQPAKTPGTYDPIYKSNCPYCNYNQIYATRAKLPEVRETVTVQASEGYAVAEEGGPSNGTTIINDNNPGNLLRISSVNGRTNWGIAIGGSRRSNPNRQDVTGTATPFQLPSPNNIFLNANIEQHCTNCTSCSSPQICAAKSSISILGSTSSILLSSMLICPSLPGALHAGIGIFVGGCCMICVDPRRFTEN